MSTIGLWVRVWNQNTWEGKSFFLYTVLTMRGRGGYNERKRKRSLLTGCSIYENDTFNPVSHQSWSSKWILSGKSWLDKVKPLIGCNFSNTLNPVQNLQRLQSYAHIWACSQEQLQTVITWERFELQGWNFGSRHFERSSIHIPPRDSLTVKLKTEKCLELKWIDTC